MSARPHVLISAAMSVDGCIDDSSPRRLILSDAADLDRVDELRAGVDAILVGAATVRADDPRLLVRSPARRAARRAARRPESPLKVTLTGTGELDPAARFFTTGDGEKLVYATGAVTGRTRDALGATATVVESGDPLDLHRVLGDLRGRGVERLMVEGGTAVHTLFLTEGVVDEIQLAVAPFFVGDAGAPRFVGPGSFPHGARHRMRLVQASAVGDLVVLRYLLGGTDGRP